MSKSLHCLGARSLRQICLPESHDSGMGLLTTHTIGVDTNNTVTQWHSIGEQLGFGIRMFDLRPAIIEINGTPEYYTGHYSY